MRTRSLEETQAALATTERILVSLRREPDSDALRQLIQAVEDQQTELLSILDARAPEPTRADA